MHNEEYPPFFELDVVWDVGFGFAVEVESYFQVAPLSKGLVRCKRRKRRDVLFGMGSGECDVCSTGLLL